MSSDADLYFIGIKRRASKTDRRLDGYFVIPRLGFSCKACSGSSKLQPLPPGEYLATNFRDRTDPAMVKGGVGFSVDLSDKWDPALKRMRSLLRIHPDGNLPGTQGCVGIIGKVQQCRDHLQEMLAGGKTLSLEVVEAKKPEDMWLITAHGCFIFG